MKVLVLGGGIVGVCSAWFLTQAGHEVTVIERLGGVARDTSLANGGQISVSHSEPWANPAAPWQVLRALGREDAPLLFRWRAEPFLWRWAFAFLRECLPARTARNMRHCVRLALYSRAQLAQLREALGIEYDHLERGILHFYTDRKAFEHARRTAELMRRLGCHRQSISAEQAVAIEPALASMRHRMVGADYCAEDGSGDAHRFTVALAQHAQGAGARFLLNHEITRVLVKAGRAVGVEVKDEQGQYGEALADAVVVALGAYSRALLLPLGIALPIYPGKGYSVSFPVTDPSHVTTVSLTDDEYKMVFSRLGHRLRVAGTAEFNGFDRSLNEARCQALLHRTQQLFPKGCDYSRPQYWAGFRPVTPSNVPWIGRTPLPGLYVNTGHGTLGWTMGVGSGRLIADVISGRPTDVALAEP